MGTPRDDDFSLRHEEIREEQLTDHQSSHPGHLTDRGHSTKGHDEEPGFDRLSTLDRLAADELRHFGHGLSKHSGRADEELSDPGLFPSYSTSGSSTTESPEQHAAMTDAVLNIRTAQVEEWLADPGSHPTQAFDADLQENTGLWENVEADAPREVSGFRVVLRRDEEAESGYAHLTGFPVPDEQLHDPAEVPLETVDENLVEGENAWRVGDLDPRQDPELEDPWGLDTAKWGLDTVKEKGETIENDADEEHGDTGERW